MTYRIAFFTKHKKRTLYAHYIAWAMRRLGHQVLIINPYQPRRILRSEGGGLAVLFYYALMHVAGIADRRGLRWLADCLRPRSSTRSWDFLALSSSLLADASPARVCSSATS